MAEARMRDAWTTALYGLLILVGVAVSVLGYLELDANPQASPLLLGLGVLTMVIPAALYPVAMALRRRSTGAGAGADEDQLLRSIHDRLMMSETAKRVVGRRQERDVLREAIREDIARRDFESAMVLVTEMGQTHGLREEAERFRQEIVQARAADYEQKVNQAIAALRRVMESGDWERAAADAEKIARVFPDSQKARDLPQRVREAREQHKHDLERQFLEAAEREEVDRAWDLLKELDFYLTEQEAEPFREIARGVIGKKRQNLGVQFKLAVSDRDARLAVRVGEQIIRDFPNSKMAAEVRSVLPELRRQAAEQQSIEQGAAASQ